jgi:hypothetical protein
MERCISKDQKVRFTKSVPRNVFLENNRNNPMGSAAYVNARFRAKPDFLIVTLAENTTNFSISPETQTSSSFLKCFLWKASSAYAATNLRSHQSRQDPF